MTFPGNPVARDHRQDAPEGPAVKYEDDQGDEKGAYFSPEDSYGEEIPQNAVNNSAGPYVVGSRTPDEPGAEPAQEDDGNGYVEGPLLFGGYEYGSQYENARGVGNEMGHVVVNEG